ncbi:phage/plasmid replication domain-containing protein [Aeromonas dhakensis]|uniref:phage/plasmid replication domain-containing protein n=1 Tax=Aeromonas dhakensis TaxID=196024 RepID=UPI00244C5565|nr:phage/plasmid replication protein [Aeromonas dhakensis]MDH0349090.1 phage/plasmid replication protein [Aeromonas dhakensis]
MFFDWLEIEQEFDYQLPLLDGNAYARLVVEDGAVVEEGGISSPAFSHKGSFCDSVRIKVNGSRLFMGGNPSRWGRVENLFGLRTIDQCVAVYNGILRDVFERYDRIPQFTKCTKVFYADGTAMEHIGADGAIIKGFHATENVMVGAGNEKAYIAGISTLSYRNSIPHLFTNGYACDWASKKGNSPLIYPSVYCKGNELELHSLDKITRAFGPESDEVEHLKEVIDYCWAVGLVRFELKFKSRYIQRNGLQYWGLSNYSSIEPLLNEFVNIDKKLSVTAMDFETISECLLSSGVVESTKAANTTAMYALQWMHGQEFDPAKRQIKEHRARLRKIGIDIARPCNISKFSPIFVKTMTEVRSQICQPPSWYRLPNALRVVA